MLLTIYADGSSQKNGQTDCTAGFGYLLICPRQTFYSRKNEITKFIDVRYLGYGFGKVLTQPSNQRAELYAVLQALQALLYLSPSGVDKVILYSDSKYVVNHANEDFILRNWIRNNWKGSDGQAIAHQDLWFALFTVIQKVMNKYQLQIEWIKGHSGNKLHDLCDKLARYGRDMSPAQYQNKTEVFIYGK